MIKQLVPKEIIPQMPLFLGHIFAKISCIGNERFIMLIIHSTIPPSKIKDFCQPRWARAPFVRFADISPATGGIHPLHKGGLLDCTILEGKMPVL